MYMYMLLKRLQMLLTSFPTLTTRCFSTSGLPNMAATGDCWLTTDRGGVAGSGNTDGPLPLHTELPGLTYDVILMPTGETDRGG